MDHLKSSEERKARWYAKHIEPWYMPVKTIDLNFIKNHYLTNNEAPSFRGETEEVRGCNFCQQSYVPGIPGSLLHQNHHEVKQFLNDQIREYGFVIIRHVLNIQQCNHAIDLAWDYLEAASSAEEYLHRRRNQDSIAQKNTNCPSRRRKERASQLSKYHPKSVEGRIFPFYGAGHSSFQWYLRSQYYVQDVFALIHSVDRNELITSLDGMILWTEYDDDHMGKYRGTDDGNKPTTIAAYDHDKGWFHIDQNPKTKPKFASVQGLVNLLPVIENTGGNVLVMGSHKMFPNHYLKSSKSSSDDVDVDVDVDEFYYERLKEINGDDWLEIDPNDTLLQKESTVMCLLGPGDMIVWDSRLIHCSYPGKPMPSSTNNEYEISMEEEEEGNELKRQGLVRAAGLVNMIPRSKCSIGVHSQRIQAIKNARTLTHWVDKASPLGEEQSKEVELEYQRVKYMRQNYQGESYWLDKKDEEDMHSITPKRNKRVLLSLDDLTAEQRKLI
mmetsp:Transcript_42573/g.47591  ORF Transcript_42573/g.47591 Transcript_42573/m.47591 type:complete len:498 (+) Transcript_42573:348-1841(+)